MVEGGGWQLVSIGNGQPVKRLQNRLHSNHSQDGRTKWYLFCIWTREEVGGAAGRKRRPRQEEERFLLFTRVSAALHCSFPSRPVQLDYGHEGVFNLTGSHGFRCTRTHRSNIQIPSPTHRLSSPVQQSRRLLDWWSFYAGGLRCDARGAKMMMSDGCMEEEEDAEDVSPWLHIC